MSIKILGGFARGQVLTVQKGDTIRPTSIMLRRRIYDFFQDLEGFYFLDLCAGSGAMGFEAWSRGASRVYLNEVSKHVLKTLEDNRENLLIKNHHKKSGEIKVSNAPAEKFIREFKRDYQKFDEEQKKQTIIFLDPPYSLKSIYFDVVSELIGSAEEDPWYFGQLWIESDPKKGIPRNGWSDYNLKASKLFEQGENYIFVTIFPQS
ncbi:MAG: RsmD family RNA methyltransferase [Bacteriovorax sp.]|nr:RsmD family RNA methyltransferase [Bacteriovorax sp.]